MSLAYFSSGYEIEECELAMLEFNDRLASPLTDRELTRIIRSAYSGKYQAAHIMWKLAQGIIVSTIILRRMKRVRQVLGFRGR